MPAAQIGVWKDLNVSTNNAPLTTDAMALCELIANAFDANRVARIDAAPVIRKDDNGDVVIEDRGNGIEQNAFVVGRFRQKSPSELGTFGLGLKDALAVIMRGGATVVITSRHGLFTFRELIGNLTVPTIHMSCTTTSNDDSSASAIRTGTTIRVQGLPGAAHSLAEARSSFLALDPALSAQDRITVLTAPLGAIHVFAPRLGHRNLTYIYVNGVKKATDHPMKLCYNILPASAAHGLFDRDHRVAKLGQVYKGLEEGFRALGVDDKRRVTALVRSHVQHASCEFSTRGMQQLFFPEHNRADAGAAPVVAPPIAVAGPAAPPPQPAARTRALILYDYENAHNAREPLDTFVTADAGVCMFVFTAQVAGIPPPWWRGHDRVTVMLATTAAPQAADTLLCVHAGMQHLTLPPDVQFLVVCGAEGRYPELVAALTAYHRTIQVIRFVDDASFTAALRRI